MTAGHNGRRSQAACRPLYPNCRPWPTGRRLFRLSVKFVYIDSNLQLRGPESIISPIPAMVFMPSLSPGVWANTGKPYFLEIFSVNERSLSNFLKS